MESIVGIVDERVDEEEGEETLKREAADALQREAEEGEGRFLVGHQFNPPSNSSRMSPRAGLVLM